MKTRRPDLEVGRSTTTPGKLGPASSADVRQRTHWWKSTAWIVAFLSLTSLLQWNIPYPIDDDTAYHFTVGQLINRHGILHSFPWTPLTWQFDHYADKELLFHLLFLPLGGLGLLPAQRIVGAIAGAAILCVMYLVLRAERVRLAGLWVLLPLACGAFVFRFAQVRPHLLSIALAILLLWAVARGKLLIVAIVALIYPLAYVAFWQIPLAIIVAAESGRVLAGQPIRWQPAAVAAAGVAAGVLLHPNAANLLGLNWIHMADVLYRNAWSAENPDINIGNEYSPFPVVAWARFLLVAVLMTAGAAVVVWRERRSSSIPMAFVFAAVIFGVLTAKTARFVEYFVPFSVLALAISTSKADRPGVVWSLLGASSVYAVLVGSAPYSHLASLDTKSGYIEPDTARQFSQHVPVDSQVFTCGWEYTGSLMVALPERRFVVVGEPTLLYKKNPDLFAVWNRLPLAAPPDAVTTIREQFKSRFVVCRNARLYASLLDRLRLDPGVKTLVVSPRWVLFDVGDGSGNARSSTQGP